MINETNESNSSNLTSDINQNNIAIKKKTEVVNTQWGSPLLDALWRSPDLNHQLTTGNRATGSFQNVPVTDAAAIAQQIARAKEFKLDLFLAIAEYKTAESRKASNAAGASCFLMDVDVGKDKAKSGKGYGSIEEAKQALPEFCMKASLPSPNFVVCSGSGLHVYWVLTDFIEREQWQATARQLKALTKAHGFLADDSRTADIASVLRVPGTMNYKTNPPKEVVLL